MHGPLNVKFNFALIFVTNQAKRSAIAHQLNRAQWTTRLSYTLWNDLTVRCLWEKEQNIAVTTANDHNYRRPVGIILEFSSINLHILNASWRPSLDLESQKHWQWRINWLFVEVIIKYSCCQVILRSVEWKFHTDTLAQTINPLF